MVFAGRAEWRAWLEQHHDTATAAWVVHSKKGAPRTSLAYEDGVEEALCFGWIDGQLRRLDAERFVLRYSPRKRGSVWAASNVARVERLITEGRMTQAGLDRIEEAKRSGAWDAATQREGAGAIPRDLEEALAGDACAAAWFRDLPASRRKALLWWIDSAKKPETRERRVRTVVATAAEERRVPQ